MDEISKDTIKTLIDEYAKRWLVFRDNCIGRHDDIDRRFSGIDKNFDLLRENINKNNYDEEIHQLKEDIKSVDNKYDAKSDKSLYWQLGFLLLLIGNIIATLSK